MVEQLLAGPCAAILLSLMHETVRTILNRANRRTADTLTIAKKRRRMISRVRPRTWTCIRAATFAARAAETETCIESVAMNRALRRACKPPVAAGWLAAAPRERAVEGVRVTDLAAIAWTVSVEYLSRCAARCIRHRARYVSVVLGRGPELVCLRSLMAGLVP